MRAVQIIGLYFFPDRLTDLNFYENSLPVFLDDENEDVAEMYFWPDGVPAHYRLIVRHFLHINFRNTWIYGSTKIKSLLCRGK